jgi:hypothetical protein
MKLNEKTHALSNLIEVRNKMKTKSEVVDESVVRGLPSMSVSQIARIIRNDWQRVNYAAVPYLEAMFSLSSVDDYYLQDTGRDVVLRFLCNAGSWRGPIAKAVKAELKLRANSK